MTDSNDQKKYRDDCQATLEWFENIMRLKSKHNCVCF